ncbi:MAG TPA: hypothetical protein VLK27_12840 [Chthoniobacterales bacterium]|nr:hypothetical protein [Chthoniobacterales bacterium]
MGHETENISWSKINDETGMTNESQNLNHLNIELLSLFDIRHSTF